MKFSLYFDYSLRVLIYLANKPGETITIAEIADFFNISRNHLVKVVHQLGIRGYIDTTRGKRGGLRLARAPDQIVIGDVTRKMEPDFNLFECFDHTTSRCNIAKLCTMKSIAVDAIDAFLAKLDDYTLADIVSRQAVGRKVNVPYVADIPIFPIDSHHLARNEAAND